MKWVVVALASIVVPIWNILTTLIMLVVLPFLIVAKSIEVWIRGEK